MHKYTAGCLVNMQAISLQPKLSICEPIDNMEPRVHPPSFTAWYDLPGSKTTAKVLLPQF